MTENKNPEPESYDAVPEYIIAQALAGDREPLLMLLRNGDRHLTPDERAVAASIIAGELLSKRGAGRPPSKKTPTAELGRWAVSTVLGKDGYERDAQNWRASEMLGVSKQAIINAVNAVDSRNPSGAEKIARRLALQWARAFVDKELNK